MASEHLHSPQWCDNIASQLHVSDAHPSRSVTETCVLSYLSRNTSVPFQASFFVLSTSAYCNSPSGLRHTNAHCSFSRPRIAAFGVATNVPVHSNPNLSLKLGAETTNRLSCRMRGWARQLVRLGHESWARRAGTGLRAPCGSASCRRTRTSGCVRNGGSESCSCVLG